MGALFPSTCWGKAVPAKSLLVGKSGNAVQCSIPLKQINLFSSANHRELNRKPLLTHVTNEMGTCCMQILNLCAGLFLTLHCNMAVMESCPV